VCKARFLTTVIEGYQIPKRSHHPLCILNSKTKGKGLLSEQQKVSLEDNKRYKELVRPITAAEKGSYHNLPTDCGAAFVTSRVAAPKMATNNTNIIVVDADNELSPSNFCKALSKSVVGNSFVKKHAAKGAPLAMIAFANEVAEKIIRNKLTSDHFDKLTMEVPDCPEANDNPQHNSIVARKLLLVDWERNHGSVAGSMPRCYMSWNACQ